MSAFDGNEQGAGPGEAGIRLEVIHLSVEFAVDRPDAYLI
jgi:hypothetical protein